MMGPIDRDFIVHLVVASALCVGGWRIFAQPKLAELEQLELRIKKSRTGVTIDQQEIGRIAEQLRMLSDRAAKIRDQSRSDGDSSKLYGIVTALARDHDVVVPSLDTGATARPSEGRPVAATPIDLTIEGEYDSVAMFLHALDGLAGFVRPVSLILTPLERDGTPVVRGRYVCEAVSFHVSEALSSITGEDLNGQ